MNNHGSLLFIRFFFIIPYLLSSFIIIHYIDVYDPSILENEQRNARKRNNPKYFTSFLKLFLISVYSIDSMMTIF